MIYFSYPISYTVNDWTWQTRQGDQYYLRNNLSKIGRKVTQIAYVQLIHVYHRCWFLLQLSLNWVFLFVLSTVVCNCHNVICFFNVYKVYILNWLCTIKLFIITTLELHITTWSWVTTNKDRHFLFVQGYPFGWFGWPRTKHQNNKHNVTIKWQLMGCFLCKPHACFFHMFAPITLHKL